MHRRASGALTSRPLSKFALASTMIAPPRLCFAKATAISYRLVHRFAQDKTRNICENIVDDSETLLTGFAAIALIYAIRSDYVNLSRDAPVCCTHTRYRSCAHTPALLPVAKRACNRLIERRAERPDGRTQVLFRSSPKSRSYAIA